MGDKEFRNKPDRDLTPDFGDGALDVEKSPDLDSECSITGEGCPTCGNKDIQSAELLEAWKDIEKLEADIEKILAEPYRAYNKRDGGKQLITIPPDIDWEKRYELIKNAYVKTRLEVSGSFGNWDYNTRKRVLENEISAELGFKV